MKVLFVSNGFPTAKRPSYCIYLPVMIDCIRAAGNEVDVLSFDRDCGGRVSKLFAYLGFYLRLFFARTGRYDALYINFFPYCAPPLAWHILKFKRQGKPVFAHWHGSDLVSRTALSRFLLKCSGFLVDEKITLVGPSGYFAGRLSDHFGIPRERIIVSPSGGVDTEIFRETPHRRAGREDLIRIGYASHVFSFKGIDLVCDALERLDRETAEGKLEFHFISYGPERDIYEPRLLALKNIKTVRHDTFPKEKMPEFYNSVDLLLFPSEHESLGLVGVEAISCGVPIIGPRAHSIEEYVIPGVTGESYEHLNRDSFFEAVKRCMNNLGGYSMGNIIEERYSRTHVVKQYQEMFSQ